jgi:DinB family protein
MNSLAPLLDRLSAAGARMDATRPAVEAGAPWTVGRVDRGEPEAEWAPPEVLAHVAEMVTYWLGELERVVAGTAGPAPFGRTADDQIRSLTVTRDATLPARELYDRIGAGLDRYRRRVPQLSEEEIARQGVHPVRGPMSAAELLDRLVVSHLEGHAEQMERALQH